MKTKAPRIEVERFERGSCLLFDIVRNTYDAFDPNCRHQGSMWCLDYFSQPGLEVRVRSEQAPWRKREACTAHLYPPYKSHWESLAPGGPGVTGIWASFWAMEEANLASLICGWEDRMAVFEDPERVLEGVLIRLAEGAERWADDQRLLQDVGLFDPVLELLHGAIRISAGRYRIVGGVRRRARGLVANVDQYLRHHYARPITREDVARHLGVSVSTLSHEYARQTGHSPTETLRLFRVQAAAQLIDQKTPLKDVADTVGFCDTAYLSHAFKRVLGVTPRQYRKAAAETATITPADRPLCRHPGVDNFATVAAAADMRREGLDACQRNAGNVWTLDLFLTPGVRFRVGDENAPWQEDPPGTLRLYSPGCVYWEDGARAARPIASLSVGFRMLRTSPLARKVGQWPSLTRFHDPEGRARPAFERLARLWTEAEVRGREISQALHELLGWLRKAAAVGKGEFVVTDGVVGGDARVDKAVHFMKRHCPAPLTLEAVARHVGLSRSALSRRFLLAMGEAPMERLRRIRLDRARELLGKGRPVCEVAEAVGIPDPATFSRIFRRVVGVRPSAYGELAAEAMAGSGPDLAVPGDRRGAAHCTFSQDFAPGGHGRGRRTPA